MIELVIIFLVFAALTYFANKYIKRYVKNKDENVSNDFYSNEHIFESIPSIFPTVGIFLTAVGIIIGLVQFNENDIKSSITDLLGGIKFSFIATATGLFLLLVFQKIIEYNKNKLELNDLKKDVQSNEKSEDFYRGLIEKLEELGKNQLKSEDQVELLKEQNEKLSELFNLVELHKQQNTKLDEVFGLIEKQKQIDENILKSIEDLKNQQTDKSELFTNQIKEIEAQLREGNNSLKELQVETNSILTTNLKEVNHQITSGLDKLNEEVSTSNKKTIEISEGILESNIRSNEIFETKFEDFIRLLEENNTKGLVEVMKAATEEFNNQMADLINKLVQENFAQLNESVENLNSWQKENIENISALTSHFKETTELFSHSSLVLKEVAENTKQLVSDDGKLKEIIQQLSTVLIDDEKFVSITSKLSNTIDLVEKSTILYEETSSKLNQWVVNEYEFKQGVEILITKLEEFKDFNGELWISYRKEMQEAVNIIKDTTNAFNDNVDNLNAEFYARLSSTLESLDSYIVTLIERERDE
jgi:biopolymer transport protein ExbB/TolQ